MLNNTPKPLYLPLQIFGYVVFYIFLRSPYSQGVLQKGHRDRRPAGDDVASRFVCASVYPLFETQLEPSKPLYAHMQVVVAFFVVNFFTKMYIARNPEGF